MFKAQLLCFDDYLMDKLIICIEYSDTHNILLL